MNWQRVTERQEEGKYPYGWSVNICINPYNFIWLIVWWREIQYQWEMRTPFRIKRHDPNQPHEPATILEVIE